MDFRVYELSRDEQHLCELIIEHDKNIKKMRTEINAIEAHMSELEHDCNKEKNMLLPAGIALWIIVLVYIFLILTGHIA
jgi:cell division protein FtsB